MFQGFIFDVEGTLVDSVPQNLRSLQDALDRSGYRVPIQTLQLYSGLDGDQTLQLAVPEASPDERRAILKDQGSIYERNYLPSVKPFESVRDVFRILTEQGSRVALATDCKGIAFKRYMALVNADDFIAATAAATTWSTESPTRAWSGWPCVSSAFRARRRSWSEIRRTTPKPGLRPVRKSPPF
jgi:beta-phosphoglucomutase-like phosphatase (HAD superfamily)